MRIGDTITCECGAKGQINIFPCGEKNCTCGGWFGITWDGVNYERQSNEAGVFFDVETFLREDVLKR